MRAGRIRLANTELEVEVVPAEGGRIASIRSRSSGVEFLTQAHEGRTPSPPGLQADFSRGPCAGAEECLPTVGACEDMRGRPAPDHGDFWQIPWTVREEEPGCLSMHATGFSRPLRLERRLRLKGSAMELEYTVRNVGTEAVSFLYAWHPLFATDPGDRVVLPSEVEDLALIYSSTGRLGSVAREVAWPLAGGKTDLSVAQSPDAGTAEMFYTRMLSVGRCGLYRNAAQQGIIVRFDPERLPFLGLWFCFGGWPDDARNGKQVAIALEPTVAPYGTLREAEANGLAPLLQPSETMAWRLSVELTAPGQTYAQVVEQVRSSPERCG